MVGIHSEEHANLKTSIKFEHLVFKVRGVNYHYQKRIFTGRIRNLWEGSVFRYVSRSVHRWVGGGEQLVPRKQVCSREKGHVAHTSIGNRAVDLQLKGFLVFGTGHRTFSMSSRVLCRELLKSFVRFPDTDEYHDTTLFCTWNIVKNVN